MNKYRVVWVPGYDHAGIATQGINFLNLYHFKVVKYLNMF
jgi:valyl-tRNA synthetase